MQHHRVRTIPTDIGPFASRVLDVELTPLVTFHMQEALFQDKPNHWARIWPTSVALSRWLLEQPPGTLPAGAKELGCGMGLVSMTLAHLGIDAEGTDREPLALAFATANAKRNALTHFTASHLDWSEPQGAPTLLMVAADIIYEKETPAKVFNLVQSAALLLPRGRLLIGCPRARGDLLAELIRRLTDHGYAHAKDIRTVAWKGESTEIDTHVLTRPA